MKNIFVSLLTLVSAISFHSFVVSPSEVLASNTPNGILVRAVNNPRVYYMENGQKRYVWSPQMLESQFRWDDVVLTSPADLRAIPNGPQMTFRDGSLISNRGSVFVISNGQRLPIESANTFLQKGYKWSNVIPVSNAEADIHPRGSMLRASDIHPDGTLLLAPSGRMYVLEDGKRRYIPSPLIFEARYRWEAAVSVSQEVINSYPQGGDQFYPDGLLIASATGVYFMQNNRRQPIHSPAIFESYGLNWDKVRRATDFELSIIPRGPAFARVKTYANNTLVTPDNTSEIFVFQDGSLKHVPSMNVFHSYGYRQDEIIQFPARVITQYSRDGRIGFKDGTLIADTRGVFLIENGQRRAFPNPDVFLARGYKWEDVVSVTSAERDLHPQGPGIADVVTATLQGYTIPATSGKTATEQYLHTRCDETANQYYNRIGIPSSPSWLRNGVLAGGSFTRTCPSGSLNPRATTTASAAEAKYYINMRWNYTDWYEARTSLTSNISSTATTIPVNNASQFPNSGFLQIGTEIIAYTKDSNTQLKVVSRGHDQGAPTRNRINSATITSTSARNHSQNAEVRFVYKFRNQIWYPRPFNGPVNSTARNWHERKRVLVTNPANGKRVVAAIMDAGPAQFTDRVSGLSSAAMYELGASVDTNLEYGFLIDQSISPGPYTP